MDVDISIGDDRKMPAADNSEGKMTTAFSKCYYLVVISYHLLTTHNNIPADNCPPSNRGRSRGGRGGMALNNNSMYGDERFGVGACDRRSSSPTKTMRSGNTKGGGRYIGVGGENESSLINSPDPKKKGMFYFVVHIVCILFIVCILILQL